MLLVVADVMPACYYVHDRNEIAVSIVSYFVAETTLIIKKKNFLPPNLGRVCLFVRDGML